MVFFRDIALPTNTELRAALQHIPGLGKWKSTVICSRLGLMFPFFFSFLKQKIVLNNEDVKFSLVLMPLLFFYIKFYVLPLDNAKRKKNRHLKILASIRSLTAVRRKDFLPLRGQRTRSNMGTLKRLRLKALS